MDKRNHRNSRFMQILNLIMGVKSIKRPITWSFFNPGVELSPVNWAKISALASIQRLIKSNGRLHGNIFNSELSSTPGLKFQVCQFA